MFHFKYFLFFFVSRMILSAICISYFFQAIFLHMIRVLFTPFCTCLLSSTGFLVVSIFLAFEASQGRRDVLSNSLKPIADLLLLGSTGLIKFQDVIVNLDSFFAFSDGDSSYICNSLFSQGWCYLFFCSKCLLPTTDNSFGSVEFLMLCISSYEIFLFNMFSVSFRQSTSTSKLLLSFLNSFRSSPCRNNFFMGEGENLTRLTSSKDSITSNLGKTAASLFESDSERFRLVFFYLKMPYMLYIF